MASNNAYNLNESFFENIDSPEKAYALGFICADGRIQGPSNNQLNLNLKLRDVEVLGFIKESMSYDGPIQINTSKNYCRLRITRKKICDDLSKYGVIPNKTFSITIPKIGSELMKYLILGWFDGDGCICNYVDNKGRFVSTFSIIGNECFIQDLCEFFETYLNITLRTVNKGNVTEAMTTKQDHIEVIYKFLYEDHSLGLSRKREGFYLAYKYALSRLERRSTTIMLTPSKFGLTG